MQYDRRHIFPPCWSDGVSRNYGEFLRGPSGRGRGLFVTCPRSRGQQPSARRRRGIAADRLCREQVPGPHRVREADVLKHAGTRGWACGRGLPRPFGAKAPDGWPTAKETRATVQSHPVKRVVSGASRRPRCSLSSPWPSRPPQPTQLPPLPPGPARLEFKLGRPRQVPRPRAQAEKANEDLLKGQDDLTAKQGDLDKANAVSPRQGQAAQAAGNEKKYRVDVDKFAGARSSPASR